MYGGSYTPQGRGLTERGRKLALIDIKNARGEKTASPPSSAGKTKSKASHWVRKISTSCVIDTGLIFKQTEATLKDWAQSWLISQPFRPRYTGRTYLQTNVHSYIIHHSLEEEITHISANQESINKMCSIHAIELLLAITRKY